LAVFTRVEEVPAFSREETYLFLWTAPNGTYRILGWTQGAFRIRKDQTTGLESVTQDSAAAPLFDPVTQRFRHGGIRNLPIAVFQVKLKRVELYCRRPYSSMADTISQNCPSATAIPYTQNPSTEQSQIGNAMQTLCRNATTDAGWPSQFSCTVPAVNTEFTVRSRPGP